MATRKQKGFENPTGEVPKGFRSYKSDTGGFYDLKENSSVQGVYLGCREQEIKDKRTKQMKMIRIYRIKTDEGTINIGSRAMLDRTFDDLKDDVFGGSDEGMKGLQIVINRGEDTETGEQNPMGTYEILIEDPDQASFD